MKIAIIGVPYDLAEPDVGKGRAPTTLLAAGLHDRLAALGCEIASVEDVRVPDSGASQVARIGAIMAQLGQAVARTRAEDLFPLVLGGDCLVSLGVLAGLGDAPNTGIVWIDAHGDFNTPDTTLSGYLGGMPLACAVGRGLPELREAVGLKMPISERNVMLVNARDLDPPEERALNDSDVTLMGIDGDSLQKLSKLRQVYLHLDIDVLDPTIAPGVDYPVPDGLDVAQLSAMLQRAAKQGNMAALALTAVNPDKDRDDLTVHAALAALDAAMGAICA